MKNIKGGEQMKKKLLFICFLVVLLVAFINITIVRATELEDEFEEEERPTIITTQQNTTRNTSTNTAGTVYSQTSNGTKNQTAVNGVIKEGITDGKGALPQTGEVADLVLNSLYVVIIICSVCLVVVLISSVKEK